MSTISGIGSPKWVNSLNHVSTGGINIKTLRQMKDTVKSNPHAGVTVEISAEAKNLAKIDDLNTALAQFGGTNGSVNAAKIDNLTNALAQFGTDTNELANTRTLAAGIAKYGK